MVAIPRRRIAETAMNHKIWTATAARVIALTFVLAGLAACGERHASNDTKTPPAADASPSAVVIGTAPAQPTGDPAGTTPASPNTSDVTKQEESVSKPQEGDNHSYSTVAPTTPQKSDGVNHNGDGGENAAKGTQ
jgi:hypothetical protein